MSCCKLPRIAAARSSPETGVLPIYPPASNPDLWRKSLWPPERTKDRVDGAPGEPDGAIAISGDVCAPPAPRLADAGLDEEREGSQLDCRRSLPAGRLRGKVVLFRCENRIETDPPDSARLWQRLAKDLTILEVPGDHNSILQEPGVQILAGQMLAYLENKGAKARNVTPTS